MTLLFRIPAHSRSPHRDAPIQLQGTAEGAVRCRVYLLPLVRYRSAAEALILLLEEFLSPPELLYVRNHGPVPKIEGDTLNNRSQPRRKGELVHLGRSQGTLPCRHLSDDACVPIIGSVLSCLLLTHFSPGSSLLLP